MDESIRLRHVPNPTSLTSWAGYWAGYDGAPLPGAVPPDFILGYRAGRVDARRETISLAQAVALAEQAFQRYAGLPVLAGGMA